MRESDLERGHFEPLLSGQTVSHFEILAPLGRGGRGVVYKAKDRKLDRLVALKCLPAHLSHDPLEKKRIVHEARMASALDHPNICTIHAIEETPDGQVFIAMTLYEGETLEARIGRGPLSVAELAAYALQVAAGLEAAHARGIIHRDIKPGNLMITREGVVKILDFGLSKPVAGPSKLTQSGMVMGTVAYMSPEQAQGEELDGRTDIWSLGVVLFEMATGRRPFPGASALAVLMSITTQPFDPLVASPGLPRQLHDILARSLAKDRHQRYTDVAALAADLGSLMAGAGSVDPLARTMVLPTTGAEPLPTVRPSAAQLRRWLPWGLVGGALVLVLSVLLLGGSWRREPTAVPRPVAEPVTMAAPAEQSSPTIAFLGFAPLVRDPERAWLGTALGELLAFELDGIADLAFFRPADETVHLAALRQAEVGESLQDRSALQLGSVLELDRELDATWLLGGFYRRSGEGYGEGAEVELVLMDQRSGQRIEGLDRTVDGRHLLAWSEDVAAALGQTLGVAAQQGVPPGTSRRAGNEARPFATAWEKLRVFDGQAAQDLFQQELEREPGDPWLHAGLATALRLLGHEDEALVHAERASQLAKGLPRPQGLNFLALRLEAQDEHRAAAAILRALRAEDLRDHSGGFWDLGERLDIGLRLVLSLARGGEGEEALEVLDNLHPPRPDDPRLALARAEVARGLSRFRDQQRAAERAILQAARREAPFLEARGRYFDGEALRRLGDFGAAQQQLEAARDAYARLGQARGEADVWNTLGNLHWDQQNLLGAKNAYEQAARRYAAIGNERGRARALQNRALVLRERGDLEAALEVFDQALQSHRETGDHIAEAILLVNVATSLTTAGRFPEAEQAFADALSLAAEREPTIESFVLSQTGWFLMLRGDLAAAENRLEQARAMQQQTGDRLSIATTSLHLAQVAHHQGDLEQAGRLQESALAFFEETDNRSAMHTDLLRARGDTLMVAGALAAARQRYERALAMQPTFANPRRAAETRLSLAALRVEEGALAEAEALAQESLRDLERSQANLEASRAHEILARVFLAQGKLAAAQGEIEEARQHLASVESPLYRLPVERAAALLAARDESAGRVHEQARQELQSLLARAATGGFAVEELAMRLALAENDLEAGDLQIARSRLAELEEEARTRGFGLIAAKAAKALAAR